jgi:hypothetical protein
MFIYVRGHWQALRCVFGWHYWRVIGDHRLECTMCYEVEKMPSWW